MNCGSISILTLLLVLLMSVPSRAGEEGSIPIEGGKRYSPPFSTATFLYDRYRAATFGFHSLFTLDSGDESTLFLVNHWNEAPPLPLKDGESVELVRTGRVKRVFSSMAVRSNVWNRYLLWLLENGTLEGVRLAGTGIRGKKFSISIPVHSLEVMEPVITDMRGRLLAFIKTRAPGGGMGDRVECLVFDRHGLEKYPVLILNDEMRDSVIFIDEIDRAHILFTTRHSPLLHNMTIPVNRLGEEGFNFIGEDLSILQDGESVVRLIYATLRDGEGGAPVEFPTFFVLLKRGHGLEVMRGIFIDPLRGKVFALQPAVLEEARGKEILDILPISTKKVLLLFADREGALFLSLYGRPGVMRLSGRIRGHPLPRLFLKGEAGVIPFIGYRDETGSLSIKELKGLW